MSVWNSALTVAPQGGPAREFAIADDTRIVRGPRRADTADLKPGGRVLVITEGAESREATIIVAFPATEEESSP